MREAFLILALVIGVVLFIAHKKNWIGQGTFQALGAIFGILGALAAVFVFVIPAAQPTPENKNEGNPRTNTITQNLNSNQPVKWGCT